jgi:DNA-3-methyladenine glycosylase II
MVVHMPLGFDFDDARKHLTAADPRFGPLFAKLRCKPFEELETREAGMVNPFRSLASSILGQQVRPICHPTETFASLCAQISWLAARSITHKFLRIYTPSLPEKYDALAPPSPWPTPAQVLATPMTRLREAGLSGRKAEYILDLAARFSDGRLDPTKLIAMSDEEVMEHLVAVRGIGRWTVEMFQIFVRPARLSGRPRR